MPTQEDDSYRLLVRIAAQLPEQVLRQAIQDLIVLAQGKFSDDMSPELRELIDHAKRAIAE